MKILLISIIIILTTQFATPSEGDWHFFSVCVSDSFDGDPFDAPEYGCKNPNCRGYCSGLTWKTGTHCEFIPISSFLCIEGPIRWSAEYKYEGYCKKVDLGFEFSACGCVEEIRYPTGDFHLVGGC